jgi:cellobiose epimerase
MNRRRTHIAFRSLFITLSILVSVNLRTVNAEDQGDKIQKARLTQLKNEVSLDLTQDILRFWTTRMVDFRNGGFYGRIDADDKVFPEEDKGGILNARILWTYSSAYRILKDTTYLRLAKRSKDYIIAHFIDKEYGGAYRSVRSDGNPSDTRKQVYTQSFFIYGLTEYYRATGDSEALETAKSIFELFEKYALDTEFGGYFEVFKRDWQRTHDLLIGEKSVDEEKTMNTHLHIMEAYSNLYRVWPDRRVADRLKNLIGIFLDKIVDSKSFHLTCFFNKKWEKRSSVDSYGHDIESSWLLVEAAGLINDPSLSEKVKETSIRIANAALEGFQPDGSMVYEKDNPTGKINYERSWWVQAETIVGYLNTYMQTANVKYLDYSIKCWNYTKNHFIDKTGGGWFSSVTASGDAGRGDKGGFWVCPYHNGRMCLEVIERVSDH